MKTIQPLSRDDIMNGIDRTASDLGIGAYAIRFPTALASILVTFSQAQFRAVSANPAKLRLAAIETAVCITVGTAQHAVPEFSIALGVNIVREWLQTTAFRPRSFGGDIHSALSSNRDDPDKIRTIFDKALSDPVRVFAASPITTSDQQVNYAASPEYTEIVDALRRSGSLVISAAEISCPQVDLIADDPSWRKFDENTIRQCDIAVIFHEKPATGLGTVFDIARNAGVPVVIIYDGKLSPMITGSTANLHLIPQSQDDAGSRLIELIDTLGEAMLNRREVVDRALSNIRRQRLSKADALEALSIRGLTRAPETTLTRARLREMLADDLVYATASPLERALLDDLLRHGTLPSLSEVARNALALTAENQGWSEAEVRIIELEAREVLSEGTESTLVKHNSNPESTYFWLALYRRLFD